MKRLLILDSCLSTYRIDFHNDLARNFIVNALLTGDPKEFPIGGYDLEAVNSQACFPYRYYSKGLRLGDHLISIIYFRVIKKLKPDIVISNELGFNTLISVLLKPFYNYRLFPIVDDSPVLAKNYGFFRSMLRKFIIRNADGFVVVNPQVRDFLEQKYGRYRCKYYYFPIIQNDELLRDRLQQALPLSKQIFEQHSFSGKKVILFVGRLIDIKVPDLLLKVFYDLYQNNPDLRLALTGDGVMEKELKEFVATHQLDKVVHFTGRLTGNDLYAWYNIGQIFVLPSRIERFGAVVNESLVAGCQVVVSDSVGAGCLINDANGLIFKTDDHASLRNALFNVLEKIEPMENVVLKKNNMEESFSEIMDKFIDFIS